MSNVAVFPGSFDPITIGHTDIVARALPLFDRVIIAIGVNSAKQYLFDLERRKGWIEAIYRDAPKVSVDTYEGLTVDYCKQQDARYLIRGLRTAADLAFEQPVAQMNRQLGDIETILLPASPEHSNISSSIVRDIIRNGGDAGRYLPTEVSI